MPAPGGFEQTINPPTDDDEANSSFALNPADAEFLLTLLVTDLFIYQWEKWIGYLVPKGADIFFAILPFHPSSRSSRLPNFSFMYEYYCLNAYFQSS